MGWVVKFNQLCQGTPSFTKLGDTIFYDFLWSQFILVLCQIGTAIKESPLLIFVRACLMIMFMDF
jgi:hypothetical protein